MRFCQLPCSYQQVTGHYATSDLWQVRPSNITTSPSKVHLPFTANMTHTLFHLSDLVKLRFSNITYVTNSFTSLTFVSESDFADTLVDTLLDFLYPTVLNPSVLVPIIVIVNLFCCFWSVLVLHNYFHKQVKSEERKTLIKCNSSSIRGKI